jgi:hypothetical protein
MHHVAMLGAPCASLFSACTLSFFFFLLTSSFAVQSPCPNGTMVMWLRGCDDDDHSYGTTCDDSHHDRNTMQHNDCDRDTTHGMIAVTMTTCSAMTMTMTTIRHSTTTATVTPL